MGRFNTICGISVWEPLELAFFELHKDLITIFKKYDDITDTYPEVRDDTIVFLYNNQYNSFKFTDLDGMRAYISTIQVMESKR